MKKRFLAALLAVVFVLAAVLNGCTSEPGTESSGAQGQTDATQSSTKDEKDYSAYQYGEIDYAADVTGIDMSLVEKKISEIDRETLEYAIQQVCLAFWYKNPNTQYDLGRFCYDGKHDAYRRTTGQSPEDTDWDTNWYSQCAEYCYDVYYELCGYEYINCGTVRTVKGDREKDPESIIESYKTLRWDREPITELILHQARPGDIFWGNGSEGGGHVMMLIGDIDGDGENDMIHCWPMNGGSTRIEEIAQNGGKQFWDTHGLELQSAYSLLISDKGMDGHPNWGIFTAKNDKTWHLMRPFEQHDIGDYHLSTDSVTRITYEGIDVYKTPDISVHHSVVNGQDITFTEVIKNHGKEDFKGLSVTEYVPDGCVLKSAEGATQDGRKIKWTIDVPAGGETTLTYTYTVMYDGGMEITVPAGLVAGLQTRTFTVDVMESGFTAEQIEKMAEIAKAKRLPKDVDFKSTNQLEFVTTFYKEILGKEIDLPTEFNTLLNGLFVEDKGVNACDVATMLFKKDDISGFEKYNDMIVRNGIGGVFYSVGEYPGVEEYTVNRILDIKEGYFMPGDVIITMTGNSKRSLESPNDLSIFIYLGDGRVAAKVGTASGVMEYNQSLELLFTNNFVIYLRPNQVQ